VEANRAGCVNYFTLRRHHYCASRDQTIREGRPASLDLGPIWRPTTCWEIVRLLGRVLIHAQIAMLRSRWNVLAIAAFFFSHWATAAEKGDDRVSDIHADRHEIISHNGSSGFGGNADSAETADLARVHHLVLSNRYFCLRLSKKAARARPLISRSNGICAHTTPLLAADGIVRCLRATGDTNARPRRSNESFKRFITDMVYQMSAE
jgi:hypothetical protein